MRVEYDGKNAVEVFEFVRRAQEAGVAVGVMTMFEAGRVEVTLMVGAGRGDQFSVELTAGDVVEVQGDRLLVFTRRL